MAYRTETLKIANHFELVLTALKIHPPKSRKKPPNLQSIFQEKMVIGDKALATRIIYLLLENSSY